MSDGYADILFLLTLPQGSVLNLPGSRCLMVVEGRGHKATDASVWDVGGRQQAEAAVSAKPPQSRCPVKMDREARREAATQPREQPRAVRP